MSRLSHLSEHSAVVVCAGPSSLNVRGLPGGEDDVSSYLSPRRKRSFLTVASIGWAPVALFSVAVRACVLPCVNGKSRDMPEGISLLLGFQDTRSARLSL